MRLNDTVSGWLLLLLGGAILFATRTFPAIAGQEIGPAFFPRIIGGGFVVCGVLLRWSGRKQVEVGVRAWESEEWFGRPRLMLNVTAVVGALLFYLLAVETLGFFITAFVFLVTLFVSFGVRGRWVAPVAAVTTIALHFSFYTLLRVPLPWGWLEGMAW